MNRQFDKRAGRFSCSMEFLHLDSDGARLLMSKIVVFKAEIDWPMNAVQYTATSEMFDPVRQGEMIPEYDIVFSGKPPQISAQKRSPLSRKGSNPRG